MASNILNLSESNFDSTLQTAQGAVVVDFWAPWCGPCRTIAPILEELASEMGDKVTVTKVNIDENQALAQKFAVRAIPTLLFFKDGKQVDQVVGLVSKKDLMSKIAAI